MFALTPSSVSGLRVSRSATPLALLGFIALFALAVVWLAGSSNPYTPAGYVGYLTKGAVFGRSSFYGIQRGPTSTGRSWLLRVTNVSVTPYTYTDDFLKLLEDSFARDWRKPHTWPWLRVAWAYGFALAGVTSGVGVSLLISALSASPPARAPTGVVETSQQFRVAQ